MKIIYTILISITILSCNPAREITPIIPVELSEAQIQNAFKKVGDVSAPTVINDEKETQNKIKFNFNSKDQEELYINKSGNNFQIYLKGLKDTGTLTTGESVLYTTLYFTFAESLSKYNSSLIKLQDSSLFRLKPSAKNDTLTVESSFEDKTSGGTGNIKFIFELKEKIEEIDIKYSKEKVKERNFVRSIAKMQGVSTTQNQYKPIENNNITWDIYSDIGGSSIQSWKGKIESDTGLKPSVQPNEAIDPMKLAQIVAANIVNSASAANVNVEVEIPTTIPADNEPIKLIMKIVSARSHILELESALETYKEGKKFYLAPGDNGWDNNTEEAVRK